jgi:hypothetical protein
MISITQEQARARFVLIPPVLQDAIFSIQNAEIIASTIEKFNLSEEKAENIPTLVGWVLLGFLHPEDLTDEIAVTAGISKETAKDISDTLTTKIFNPIRTTIDGSYKPVPEDNESARIAAPKILQEIKTPVTPPSSMATQNIPQTQIPRTGAPVPPATMDVRVVPKTTVSPPPSPVTQRSIPTPAPAPVAAPKPFMFQTETVPRPIQHAPDFKIPEVAKSIMGSGQIPRPISARPAIVEFAGSDIKKSPASPAQRIPTPGMPLPNNDLPKKAEPSRTITEVTPEILKNMTPPAPQRPPSSFSPISQIPVPHPVGSPAVNSIPASTPPLSSKTPGSATIKTSIPPVPSVPKIVPTPTAVAPIPPKPPEKIIQKDYSEAEK